MRLSRLTIMVVAALLTASFTLGAADDKKCLPVNLEKNKLAFKGEEIHYIGSLELPLSKLYSVYTKALPAGKKMLHAVDHIRKK